MQENLDILELKFEGNGINPSIVKPHEIADLIVNFEKAILSTIKDKNPEIDIEQLLLSFNSIHDQSLDLRFSPRLIHDIVVTSYTLIASCVSTGDFTYLNNNTINNLKAITKFSKKYNCIGFLNYNGNTLSTFTPNTEIAAKKPTLIKGETTVFGKLIDSGGDNPNVHLRISEDQVLIFSTSHSNAKILAGKLYEKVALSGLAKWDANTLQIVDFKLTEILQYSRGNTSKAIGDLKNLTSGFWDSFKTNEDINNQLFRD